MVLTSCMAAVKMTTSYISAISVRNWSQPGRTRKVPPGYVSELGVAVENARGTGVRTPGQMIQGLVAGTAPAKPRLGLRARQKARTATGQRYAEMRRKMGIMVDGYFRCLGSGQHLKNKFGQGYQIEINVDPSGDEQQCQALIDGILTFFSSAFSNFHLIERQDNQLRLSIPNLINRAGQFFTVGALFGIIEAVKAQLSIVNYSVSQTSLEQIFNGFAKQQNFMSGTQTHAVPITVTPESTTRDTNTGGAYQVPAANQVASNVQLGVLSSAGNNGETPNDRNAQELPPPV